MVIGIGVVLADPEQEAAAWRTLDKAVEDLAAAFASITTSVEWKRLQDALAVFAPPSMEDIITQTGQWPVVAQHVTPDGTFEVTALPIDRFRDEDDKRIGTGWIVGRRVENGVVWAGCVFGKTATKLRGKMQANATKWYTVEQLVNDGWELSTARWPMHGPEVE